MPDLQVQPRLTSFAPQFLVDDLERSMTWITTTVRLWQRPHVKFGGRYALPPGEILVTKVFEVSLADVTPELVRPMNLTRECHSA